MRRPLSLLLAIVSAASAALVAIPAASQAMGSEASGVVAKTRPLAYVGLGDSYSAAAGVLPVVPTAYPACLQSTRNYPHVIATMLGADLTDVTCSGAATKDFFEAQYRDVAPQLDALSAATGLVTMTIGGNDSGVFVGAIAACGQAAFTTGGEGSPCKDENGTSFIDTVRSTTYPALVKALRAVHHRAPHATVAIIGYPWIVPDSVGCYPIVPVARGDVSYVRNLQTVLNNTVKRAAARTGSTYVDMGVVSEGHDACKPLGTRWIEPVLGTTNPVILHPNALGERNLAAQTLRVLGL